VRSRVLRLAESQITNGVNELSTVAPTGCNEKAFNIIKVVCVAVENLTWAVQSEKGGGYSSVLANVHSLSLEIEQAFQRFSSLLTVNTNKFSVLVAPLRAAMLEVYT